MTLALIQKLSLLVFAAILLISYVRQKKWWRVQKRVNDAIAVEPFPVIQRVVERHVRTGGSVPKEWDHFQAFQAKWSR